MTSGREALGQRSETVRRANLRAIVGELHLHGPLSRSELVVRTGLTRGAIRGLIGELVAAGLVTEERSAPLGNPGRPSPTVRPRDDRVVALALEIGVDSLAAATVGLGGRVLASVRVDRPRGHLREAVILADLRQLAEPLLAGLPGDHVLVGIGVAVAGVVRATDGLVRFAPNLGWRDVPLPEHVKDAFASGAPVTVANDADLGVLAEHRRGAAVGSRNVVYLSGEVGVGGGIILDGVPLHGAAGYAGELGHMPVNPDGARCRCGSRGCWETEIGERALLVRAGRSAGGGRRAIDALVAGAATGSAADREALVACGRWLGIGLAGVVNVFNPSIVVLGGLFARIHPFVIPFIERALEARALEAASEGVQVLPASLGLDAPLIGAAELAFEPLLADPAAWVSPRESLVRLASA